MSAENDNCLVRPPVVTVMGHIDHGKSTLLDYIRKTKVTESEAGGITQHISAYEAEHVDENGATRRITFLDTPGHEAFQHLRSRGSSAADLAILVVAADDGVKPQTLEALTAIQEAGIPYLVAITKIDKNNADVERAKMSLVEHGVYLEGLGGDIPYVPLSSKTGEGIPALLDLLLLSADLEELTGNPNVPAEGVVIESHCDPRRGISATLLIQNGSLKAGQYVVAGNAYAPLRIMEDFQGKTLREATFSSPLMVVGFNDTPPVGAPFITVADKRGAVARVKEELHSPQPCIPTAEQEADGHYTVPVILKSDVVGSLDALKHELRKHEDERTSIRVVHAGVGTITEGDVKYASGAPQTIIIGFNVGADTAAQEVAERLGIELAHFSIIYDLADWLPGAIRVRRPKQRAQKELGRAQILKVFSFGKKVQTIGCRIQGGELSVKDQVRVLHGEEEIGRGHIASIQHGKAEVKHIGVGNDCGVQLEALLDREPVYGDMLVPFVMTEE